VGLVQLVQRVLAGSLVGALVVAVYLSIKVGWQKRWGKLAVRISRLNTRVPGGSSVGERSSRLL
jgi:hypothetical protein